MGTSSVWALNHKYYYLLWFRMTYIVILLYAICRDDPPKMAEPKSTSSLNKQTWLWLHPLNNEHAIVSTIGCHTLTQSPSTLPCQKPTSYKVRVVFSKSFHTVRWEVVHLVPTMALSQQSLAATVCTAPCRWPHSPPPVPPISAEEPTLC